MPTTAWTNPSAAATGISGDVAWNNKDNALADDANDATAAISGFQTSEYLQVQGFGFAIPAGATIDLVEVQIDRDAVAGAANLNDIQLMSGAFGSGASLKGDPDSWNGTNFFGGSGFSTFGGSGSDGWSGYRATLTSTIVNASDFGVAIKAANVSGSNTVRVNVIQMRITYTAAADPAAELAWLGSRQPPIEEVLTEFDLLSQVPASNLDPIVAPEPEPAAGVDSASLAQPPDFPIEELIELAWLPWMNLVPIPDIPEVPGSYVGLAALSQPPEFPIEEIAELIPPPAILRPEEPSSSVTGAASYLMVPDCPFLDPDSLVEHLGQLAGQAVMNLDPLADAPESFPGTAIVSRVGIGTAIVVRLESGLQGQSGFYTAIVTRVGPGAAVPYRRSDP
jgi:hypothetical protein